MRSIDHFVENIPLLHTFDQGKSWNSGGFESWHLRKLHKFCASSLSPSCFIIKTGIGNSSLLFFAFRPW